MNIPNLPTDNLYKFIALTGVTLLIVSLFYPEYQRQSLRDEIALYNGEVSKLNIEKSESKTKQDELKKRIAILDKKSNCNCESIVNDTMIVRTKIAEGPRELVELSRQIDELVAEYFQLNKEVDLKSIEIATKLTLIDNKEQDLKEVNEATNFFGPLSLFISFFGFFLWYEKTQRHQDKVLKEQAFQYLNTDFCQSCGIRLSNQKDYHNIKVKPERNITYCQTCYKDGEFTEPNLTLIQMKDKVAKRCKELKYHRITTFILTSRIRNLDRWRDKFHW